ncbi:MAG: hypothetical protein HQK64_09210 [Desulfamplus sp.]|nr:hypothetical protein [Desulfamplus sp.]
MNSIILDRFDALESQLLENPIVISYKIIRREVAYNEGKLRFKATFIDGSMAEFFEYLVITGETIHLAKYSFHWQDAQGKLKYRWDNAPHHLDLPNAPHHRHNPDESVNGIIQLPDIFRILKEIESLLLDERKTLNY